MTTPKGTKHQRSKTITSMFTGWWPGSSVYNSNDDDNDDNDDDNNKKNTPTNKTNKQRRKTAATVPNIPIIIDENKNKKDDNDNIDDVIENNLELLKLEYNNSQKEIKQLKLDNKRLLATSNELKLLLIKNTKKLNKQIKDAQIVKQNELQKLREILQKDIDLKTNEFNSINDKYNKLEIDYKALKDTFNSLTTKQIHNASNNELKLQKLLKEKEELILNVNKLKNELIEKEHDANDLFLSLESNNKIIQKLNKEITSKNQEIIQCKKEINKWETIDSNREIIQIKRIISALNADIGQKTKQNQILKTRNIELEKLNNSTQHWQNMSKELLIKQNQIENELNELKIEYKIRMNDDGVIIKQQTKRIDELKKKISDLEFQQRNQWNNSNMVISAPTDVFDDDDSDSDNDCKDNVYIITFEEECDLIQFDLQKYIKQQKNKKSKLKQELQIFYLSKSQIVRDWNTLKKEYHLTLTEKLEEILDGNNDNNNGNLEKYVYELLFDIIIECYDEMNVIQYKMNNKCHNSNVMDVLMLNIDIFYRLMNKNKLSKSLENICNFLRNIINKIYKKIGKKYFKKQNNNNDVLKTELHGFIVKCCKTIWNVIHYKFKLNPLSSVVNNTVFNADIHEREGCYTGNVIAYCIFPAILYNNKYDTKIWVICNEDNFGNDDDDTDNDIDNID